MLSLPEVGALAATGFAVVLLTMGLHHLHGVRTEDRFARQLGRPPEGPGERLDTLLRRVPGMGLMARRLEDNGIALRLSQLLLVWIVVAYPAFLLLRSPFGQRMAIVMIAFGVPLLTLGILVMLSRRRHARLERQAVDLVRYLAGAAQAGLSVSSALRAASTEFAQPIGPELERLVLTMEFGELPADALDGFRRRLKVPEVDLLVDALVIQQRSGGDLVTLLNRLAGGLEDIGRGRRQAEGLVAALRTMPWTVLLLALLLLTAVNRSTDGILDRLQQWPLIELIVYACLAVLVATIPVLHRIVRLEPRR